MEIRYVIITDNKEVMLEANRIRIRNEGGAAVIVDDVIDIAPGQEIEFGSLDQKVKISRFFRFFFPPTAATTKVVVILEIL